MCANLLLPQELILLISAYLFSGQLRSVDLFHGQGYAALEKRAMEKKAEGEEAGGGGDVVAVGIEAAMRCGLLEQQTACAKPGLLETRIKCVSGYACRTCLFAVSKPG
jgi:hypothetical protein